MNRKINVVIVDDHKMIAEMWAELINSDPDYTVTALYDNTEAAIEFIRQNRPSIVIMDINILPMSGVEATKIVRKISPGTKVIGVSMHNQPSYAKRMLKNGASGYVTKSSSKQEMFEAMAAAIAGKIYICKEIQENLSKQMLVEDDIPDVSKLTEREIEILRYIIDGHSSKEIAQQLFLSFRTVEVHRANILKKLNQKNTPSLLKFIHNTSLSI